MDHLIKKILDQGSILKKLTNEELFILKKRLEKGDEKTKQETRRQIDLNNRLLDIIEADVHFYRNFDL